MHLFTLILNNPVKETDFVFSYGHTKNTRLGLSEKGASISVSLTKCDNTSFAGSYLENLLKEGTKRVSLIYLLRYHKPLKIRSAILSAKDSLIDLTQSLVLYSLIDQKPIRPVGDQWENPLC